MYVRSQKYSVLNRVNQTRGAICHPATKFIVHPSRIRMLEGRFEPPRALSNADFAVLTRRTNNVSITDCSNECSVAGFHGKWAHPKHAKLVIDKKNFLLQISKSCIQTCKSFELTVYIVISRLQFWYHLWGLCHCTQALGYNRTIHMIQEVILLLWFLLQEFVSSFFSSLNNHTLRICSNSFQWHFAL